MEYHCKTGLTTSYTCLVFIYLFFILQIEEFFSHSCIIDWRIIIIFCIHIIKEFIHTKIQSEYVRRRKLVVVLTSSLPDCRYENKNCANFIYINFLPRWAILINLHFYVVHILCGKIFSWKGWKHMWKKVTISCHRDMIKIYLIYD